MRKIFNTYLPASLLLAFLAMVLVTCGGGGGGGGSSAPAGDLTGLSINGPSSMSEFGTATYVATASWSDNSTSTVTPTWSVDSQMATISPEGVLSCPPIDSDQTVTVTATYSSGGITETDEMDMTITNVTTIPFTESMLSGEVFFEEDYYAEGGYYSYLSILNADFSFEQYSKETGRSEYETGTWSIDASGNLIVNISGNGTVTVMLISDSPTEMEVLVDDGSGTIESALLEKTVPVDPAKLPGTYKSGTEIFTFNADGSGVLSADFGTFSLTWSVDSGILKMIAGNGYQMWWYARAGTQSSATSYTLLKVAFAEFEPGGNLYEYYGGYEATRQ